MTTTYSPKALVDRVEEARTKHRSRDAARRAVYEDILGHGDHKAFVRDLGIWIIRLAERQERTRSVANPKKWAPPQGWGTSWRAKAKTISVWDFELPCGNKGLKRLGSWTTEDEAHHIAVHGRSAATLTDKTNRWRRIKRKQKPGETLEEIADRLTASDTAFLRTEVGLPAEEETKVVAIAG